MAIIHFDPKDQTTIDFLVDIGVPENQIATGELEQTLLELYGINSDAVVTVAISTESPDGYDYYINHNEADQMRKLIKSRGENFKVLFRRDKCPGSGVMSGTDILTAYHALYDNESDRFGDRVLVKIGDKTYVIKEENVLKKDKKLDYAIFHVEGVGTTTPIQIADRPPQAGDVVWMIGFPAQASDSGPKQKTFTVGKIREITVDLQDGSTRIETTAMPTSGNSGGALVNNSGKFIGAVSFMLLKGIEDQLLLNPSSSGANLPPGFYKGNIEQIRRDLNNSFDEK